MLDPATEGIDRFSPEDAAQFALGKALAVR